MWDNAPEFAAAQSLKQHDKKDELRKRQECLILWAMKRIFMSEDCVKWEQNSAKP